MKKPPNSQKPIERRTLESLARDLEKFRTRFKGNIKHAKEANNVIDDLYFLIPLIQVGVYLILFSMDHNNIHTCVSIEHVNLIF